MKDKNKDRIPLKELRETQRMKLNCGAERHHYSMFNVGRSMLGVHVFLEKMFINTFMV
jgi:hypothetical protein